MLLVEPNFYQLRCYDSYWKYQSWYPPIGWQQIKNRVSSAAIILIGWTVHCPQCPCTIPLVVHNLAIFCQDFKCRNCFYWLRTISTMAWVPQLQYRPQFLWSLVEHNLAVFCQNSYWRNSSCLILIGWAQFSSFLPRFLLAEQLQFDSHWLRTTSRMVWVPQLGPSFCGHFQSDYFPKISMQRALTTFVNPLFNSIIDDIFWKIFKGWFLIFNIRKVWEKNWSICFRPTRQILQIRKLFRKRDKLCHIRWQHNWTVFKGMPFVFFFILCLKNNYLARI
jgi:hypothetical protein